MRAKEKSVVKNAVQDHEIQNDEMKTAVAILTDCFAILLQDHQQLIDENESFSGTATDPEWNLLIADTVSTVEEQFDVVGEGLVTSSLIVSDLGDQLCPPVSAKYGPRTKKLCSDCGQIKRREDFGYSNDETDQRQNYCHVCSDKRTNESKKRNEARPRVKCQGECGKELPPSSFPKIRSKNGHFHICRTCCKKKGLV